MAARLAASRRTQRQLAEIEANERRGSPPAPSRSPDAPPSSTSTTSIADAAQNTLLAHVNAMVRVALEAIDVTFDDDPESERGGATHRADVRGRSATATPSGGRDGDAAARGTRMTRIMKELP